MWIVCRIFQALGCGIPVVPALECDRNMNVQLLSCVLNVGRCVPVPLPVRRGGALDACACGERCQSSTAALSGTY